MSNKLIVVKGKRNGVEYVTTEERFKKQEGDAVFVKDFKKPVAKPKAKAKPKVDSGVTKPKE